eukprot:362209-Chlamydomonas_euryale.AAC.2
MESPFYAILRGSSPDIAKDHTLVYVQHIDPRNLAVRIEYRGTVKLVATVAETITEGAPSHVGLPSFPSRRRSSSHVRCLTTSSMAHAL